MLPIINQHSIQVEESPITEIMEASDTEEFEIKTEPIDFMEAPVSNTQNFDSDTYWSCLEFEDNGRCKRYISFERDISNQSEVGDTVQVRSNFQWPQIDHH